MQLESKIAVAMVVALFKIAPGPTFGCQSVADLLEGCRSRVTLTWVRGIDLSLTSRAA